MQTQEVEKCFLCGRGCNPVAYVHSRRRHRNLPLCGNCAPEWYENGEMPD